MPNTIVTEIVDNFERLPLNLQHHVLEIVRALSRPYKDDTINNSQGDHTTFIQDELHAPLKTPQIRKLEEQHRRGYELYPVDSDEFNTWDLNAWSDK